MRVALCILALLAIPAASAAALGGSLDGSAVRTQDAKLDAPLVALLQEANANTQSASPNFDLSAQQLHLEIDNSDPAVSNPVFPFSVTPDPTKSDHTNVHVNGRALRADYRFNLFALDPSAPPMLHLEAACANAHAATSNSLNRAPIVAPQQRAAIQRDTHDAVAWKCVEGNQLTVTGNFLLTLWAWDAHLDGQDIQTGSQPSSRDPSGTLKQQKEAFLSVTNGVIQVPLAGDAYTLLVGPAHVTANSLAVDDAQGWVTVGGVRHDLSHQAARLTGLAAITIQHHQGGLHGALAGDVTEASLGAQTLVANQSPASPMPWLVLLGVALAGIAWHARAFQYTDPRAHAAGPVLTQARGWRESFGTGWWVLARRALLAGKLHRARRLARRASFWFPRSADGKMLQAVAELKLAKREAARRSLNDVLELVTDDVERAEFAILAAQNAVHLGLLDQAYEYLSIASKSDPVRFSQEIQRDIYDPLEARPEFKAVRQTWTRVVYDLFDPSFS